MCFCAEHACNYDLIVTRLYMYNQMMRRITKCQRDECQEPRNKGSKLLSTLPPQTPSQGEILGLDSDTLSVDGGQVGVLEEGDEVCLSGFLESHDGGGLETEIGLGVAKSE
jgi:hypothetical protein